MSVDQFGRPVSSRYDFVLNRPIPSQPQSFKPSVDPVSGLPVSSRYDFVLTGGGRSSKRDVVKSKSSGVSKVESSEVEQAVGVYEVEKGVSRQANVLDRAEFEKLQRDQGQSVSRVSVDPVSGLPVSSRFSSFGEPSVEPRLQTDVVKDLSRDERVSKVLVGSKGSFSVIGKPEVVEEPSGFTKDGLWGASPKKSLKEKVVSAFGLSSADIDRREASINRDSVIAPLQQLLTVRDRARVGFVSRGVESAKFVGSLALNPIPTTQRMTDNIIGVVSKPRESLFSLGSNIKYGLDTDPGGLIGGIAFDVALSSAGVGLIRRGKGLKAGEFGVDEVGGRWIKPEVQVLDRREALVQSSSAQTTLRGGFISDRALASKTSLEVFTARKSPLGLPVEWYEYVYKSRFPSSVKSPVGKYAFLDEGVGFLKFASTESGQGVVSGVGRVGSLQKSLIDRSIRVVDVVSGKERVVGASKLESALSRNRNLKVLGQESSASLSAKGSGEKFLFALDPLSASILELRKRVIDYQYKPKVSLKSSSFQQTPLKDFLSSSVESTRSVPLVLPSAFKNSDVISSSKELFSPVQEQKSFSLIDRDYKISPISASKVDQVLNQDRSLVQSSEVVQVQSLNLVQSSAQKSASKLVQSQVLEPMAVSVVTPQTISRSPIISRPRPLPSPLFMPFVKFKSDERVSPSRGSFSLLVRERGRFVLKGLFADEEEAFFKGKDIVGGSASASFKVLRDGLPVISSLGLGERFRPSKREKGVFVEKRRFRISSPGEKREITYKGLMALGSKRRIGGSGFFS